MGLVYLLHVYQTSLEIHFIHSDNKEIYFILISVSLSTKCNLFNNFTVFCSNNTHEFQKRMPKNLNTNPVV